MIYLDVYLDDIIILTTSKMAGCFFKIGILKVSFNCVLDFIRLLRSQLLVLSFLSSS